MSISYLIDLVWKISSYSKSFINSILDVVCNKYPALCLEDYSTEPADVPQNHKRAICDLTSADRLALYDHAIHEALQQRAKASNNEDLYVDLVSKLNKGESTAHYSLILIIFKQFSS